MVVQAGEGWKALCSTFQTDWITIPIAVPASLVMDDANLDCGLCVCCLADTSDHKGHHYPKDQRAFLCCQWIMGMVIQAEERLEAVSAAFQMDWTSTCWW